MQSRSYIFLIVVVVLGVLSAFGYRAKEYSYGLDVDGGVRLTYKLDFTELPADMSREEAMALTIKTLYNRAANVTGVVEATIVPKNGTEQIVVELPGGVSLKTAKDVMGSTARIQMFWAKNLNTEKANFRVYNDQKSPNPDEPEVSFTRRGSEKLITYKDEKGVKNPEYANVIAGWTEIVSGNDLINTRAVQMGADYVPGFTLSEEGGRKLAAWCRAHPIAREKLASVLDGKVISVAPLEEGAIISTEGVITGQFTPTYLTRFIGLMNSGKLPVSLDLIGEAQVDPTIGKFALSQIVNTGVIAFVITAIFLVGYYMFPGLVALFALILYVLFSLTVLKFAGATFSLAAIAGFILSIGMAVDANILVFERVKEEMREGRRLTTAIDLGFKRAFPAILDSNACTIMTSVVLWNLGTGPVKGFATTLIIGVVISLFTAITVTRSLLMFLVGSGIGANPKLYGLGRQLMAKDQDKEEGDRAVRPVLEKSKLYFGISLLTIIPGAIFLGMGGLKPNVEFTGGVEAAYVVPAETTTADLAKKLEAAGFKGANVKFARVASEKQAIITVPSSEKAADGGENIAAAIGVDIAAKRSYQSVGAVISNETIRNAILGVVISSALIILYLAIRFGFALGGFVVGFRFAMSVILALVHDILVVIGLAAIAGYLLGWDVSALFISAMLTVIGFSTHDTIVIFDRIRENLRRPHPNEDIKHLINRSITQSFARSIITSATVIVTLILLVVLGSATPDLQHFNLAMLVGIVSGTYSSIFNAAPILYLWDQWLIKKKGADAGLIGFANAAAARVRLSRDPVPTTQSGPAATQSYGQVKRRERASQFGNKPLDDEEL